METLDDSKIWGDLDDTTNLDKQGETWKEDFESYLIAAGVTQVTNKKENGEESTVSFVT